MTWTVVCTLVEGRMPEPCRFQRLYVLSPTTSCLPVFTSQEWLCSLLVHMLCPALSDHYRSLAGSTCAFTQIWQRHSMSRPLLLYGFEILCSDWRLPQTELAFSDSGDTILFACELQRKGQALKSRLLRHVCHACDILGLSHRIFPQARRHVSPILPSPGWRMIGRPAECAWCACGGKVALALLVH